MNKLDPSKLYIVSTSSVHIPNFGDDLKLLKEKIEPKNLISYRIQEEIFKGYRRGKTIKVFEYFEPKNKPRYRNRTYIEDEDNQLFSKF